MFDNSFDNVADVILFGAQTLPWVFFVVTAAYTALVFTPPLAYLAERWELAACAAEWVIRFPSTRTFLATALLVRGNVRHLRGELDAAIADFEAVIATRERAAWSAQIGLVATLIESQRDPVRAWAALDEAARSRGVVDEHLYRAHLLLVAGREAEADAAFARWRVAPSNQPVPFGHVVVHKDVAAVWRATWEAWYLVQRGRDAESMPLLARALGAKVAPIHTARARRLLAELTDPRMQRMQGERAA